jgi:hypothetical protein
MKSVLILFAGFLLAIISSELVLRGTKLQTALFKVAGIHLFWLCAVALFLYERYEFSFVVALIFWAGAFLTWFGVRSHLESSILLRMLFFTRSGPMTENDLLLKYESHHSEESRLEELFRAELLEREPNGIRITAKGRWMANVATFLHPEKNK